MSVNLEKILEYIVQYFSNLDDSKYMSTSLQTMHFKFVMTISSLVLLSPALLSYWWLDFKLSV